MKIGGLDKMLEYISAPAAMSCEIAIFADVLAVIRHALGGGNTNLFTGLMMPARFGARELR